MEDDAGNEVTAKGEPEPAHGAISFANLDETDFEVLPRPADRARFVNVDWRKGTPQAGKLGRPLPATWSLSSSEWTSTGHEHFETWFVDT